MCRNSASYLIEQPLTVVCARCCVREFSVLDAYQSQIVESVNGLFLMIEITFLIRKIQSISLRPFPGFKKLYRYITSQV